jgi:Zn-dependent protease with chaperone function
LDGPLSVPLAETKIAPRLGDTVRSLILPGGAKLETRDNRAVDRAQEMLGTGTVGRLIHRLESLWRFAIVALALLAVLLWIGFVWGIPTLARHAARLIPDEVAYDLGQGTLGLLDATILDSSELDEPTRGRLVFKFAQMAARYPDLPLELLFRRGVGPNAFALPDGTVVVMDELVELAESDAEVLAVLAHEIGHVHHRHGLRTALESSVVALLVATWLGDASALAAISVAPTIYVEAAYSRGHETEADNFALTYLTENDIPTGHFADILERMLREVGEAGTATQYISSHPPTKERIARFRR